MLKAALVAYPLQNHRSREAERAIAEPQALMRSAMDERPRLSDGRSEAERARFVDGNAARQAACFRSSAQWAATGTPPARFLVAYSA